MTRLHRIAIDSNVFRNRQFIDYLIFHKNQLDIALPIIVHLEVAYYYKIKGFTWEVFQKEMQKFNCIFLDWNVADVSVIINRIYANKNNLPFKHHIRDYLIGIQSEKEKREIITYNVSHFQWIKNVKVKTPEVFISEFQEKNAKL